MFLKKIVRVTLFFYKIVLPLHSKDACIKQTMANDIKHLGIIESIDGAHIQVRIEQSSACASCKVAHHCNASESKEKIIDVYSTRRHYEVGQQVMVCTTYTAASSAVLLGFVFPLVLLLVVLLVFKQLGYPDEYAALSGILSLVPYFFIIWLFQRRIKKYISFQIEET